MEDVTTKVGEDMWTKYTDTMPVSIVLKNTHDKITDQINTVKYPNKYIP